MDIMEIQALEERSKAVAAEAMQNASAAPCMACKRETGKPYAFAFAISHPEPGAKVIKYSDFGSLAIPLCDMCVYDFQQQELKKFRLAFWIGLPLAVLLITLGFLIGGDLRDMFLAAAALAGIFAVGSLLMSARRSKTRISGQQKAF